MRECKFDWNARGGGCRRLREGRRIVGVVLVGEECRKRPKMGWVGERKRGRNGGGGGYGWYVASV